MASVFLIGFMASGKTTVGRELARALGLPFIDLDDSIAEVAGMTISAIFAAEGEQGFRARESAALDAVLAGGDAVVATGGGAPCFGDALQRMRARGAVVALTAPFDELMARANDNDDRPLLQRPVEETRALLARRMPWYRQAHFPVDSAGAEPREIVGRVRTGLAALDRVPMQRRADSAVVALGERSYPVVVGAGALDELGSLVGDGFSAAGIVTDANVAPHYLERARASLRAAGLRTCEVIVPAGESSKQLAVAGDVAEKLIAGGLDRASIVVALGGGVIGDLAGFVAATLFRGVAVAQVPTTLLAMVDSAIGGKTGVDLPAGKNLVGAFWQPTLVLADPDTLATLPARERRAAFGELVKYGLLDGEELLEMCARLGTDVRDTDVIRRCAAYKAWTVSRDEREQTGERALLNLGHTVGHAIEAAAGYGTLLHGECVALGLIAACRVSHGLGLCGAELETRVADVLRHAGLDVDLTPWLRPDVIERIGVDKKRVGSEIKFVALEAVGTPRVQGLEVDELSRILYD